MIMVKKGEDYTEVEMTGDLKTRLDELAFAAFSLVKSCAKKTNVPILVLTQFVISEVSERLSVAAINSTFEEKENRP